MGDDYDTITYDDNGTLPEGLTIDDLGEISGTPVMPGTYNVVITVTGSKTTQGGGGGFPGFPGGPGGPGGGSTTTNTEFIYEFTLTVGGEAPEEITLESLKSQLDALASQIGDGDLASLASQLEELKAQVAQLEGSVGEGVDLTEINTQISAFETAVEALEQSSGEGGCSGSLGVGGAIALAAAFAAIGGALVVSKAVKSKKD